MATFFRKNRLRACYFFMKHVFRGAGQMMRGRDERHVNSHTLTVFGTKKVQRFLVKIFVGEPSFLVRTSIFGKLRG